MYLFGSKNSIALKRLKAITIQRQLKLPRFLWFKPEGTGSFWKNMINGVFVDEVYKKDFRLKKHEFYNLSNQFRSFIAPNTLSPNHKAMNIEKKLAKCLYFLKVMDSLRMVSNTYGIRRITAWNQSFSTYAKFS